MKLYPLKFTPISKYRIWGGNKLNTVLNKGFEGDNIGESWEISDVENDETKVVNGPLAGKMLKELSKEYKGALLGESVYKTFGTNFPLLIKFIDAKTPLSIQVHPHDAIAKERHNSFGKNEMWYIMNADEDAEIIVGFNTLLTKNSYVDYLENKNILDVLNTVTTKAGDAFDIPTGRVHAIGAGVLLAEIQQTSDITYRIFDYNRVDKTTGEERALHNDLALDVIDFEIHEDYKTAYESKNNSANKLIHTPYFKSNLILTNKELHKDYTGLDSFVILLVVEGNCTIQFEEMSYSLAKGQTLLLPAVINHILINCEVTSKILEIYI